MSFEALLTQTAEIKRATSETTSAAGEVTDNYTTVKTGEPCLVQFRGGAVEQFAVGEIVEVRATGYFMASADLRETDKVIVDGVEYYVLFPNNVRGHHFEAELYRGIRKP